MIDKINQQLFGFNVVKNLTIEIDPFTLSYDLTLILAESEALSAKELTIKFEDISQLKLTEFGGGLMQFMWLQVVKINDGLERQKYEINDLENQQISFYCFRVTVF